MPTVRRASLPLRNAGSQSSTVVSGMTADQITPALFNFLGLPNELRLMVYKNLSITIKHRACGPFVNQSIENGRPWFIFIEKTVESAILMTCRLIYQEAKPIIECANARMQPQMISDEFSATAVAACADRMVGAPWRPSFVNTLVREDEDAEAKERFLKHAVEVVKYNPSLTMGIHKLRLYDTKYFITSMIPKVAGVLTRHHGVHTTSGIKLKITLAICNLNPTGYEKEMKETCELLKGQGVTIVGAAGTPSVDWEKEWGISDFGEVFDEYSEMCVWDKCRK